MSQPRAGLRADHPSAGSLAQQHLWRPVCPSHQLQCRLPCSGSSTLRRAGAARSCRAPAAGPAPRPAGGHCPLTFPRPHTRDTAQPRFSAGTGRQFFSTSWPSPGARDAAFLRNGPVRHSCQQCNRWYSISAVKWTPACPVRLYMSCCSGARFGAGALHSCHQTPAGFTDAAVCNKTHAPPRRNTTALPSVWCSQRRHNRLLWRMAW